MEIKKQIIEIRSSTINRKETMNIIKNSGWLVGYRVFTMLIGIVIIGIIARYFGPEKYGQFSYAQSFVALFTVFSTLGLETLTVKGIIDKDYDEGNILCTSLILRCFGGILLTILASIIIRIIEPNDRNLQLLVLIMSFTMMIKSLEVIEYWIQAYQKAKISSVIRMGAYLITAASKIILIIFNGNLVNYAMIFTLDAVIIGSSLVIAYFKIRQDTSRWKFSLSYAKNILAQSWYLILSGLMITLYMKIDQVMLGSMMTTKAELGVYSAAVQIANMWYFVPMAVITSFKSVIMSKKKIDERSYMEVVQRLYTVVAWIGIGFGIFIVLFSNLIVKILFGLEYIKAANILSVSIWAGTFAMLGSARSIWLLTEGLQKYTPIYTMVGLIVNVTLNYILIPSMGGYGAAIATLCSQFSTCIIALTPFKNTRISTIMILKALSPKEFISQVMRFIK